jgi:hypothetical protein
MQFRMHLQMHGRPARYLVPPVGYEPTLGPF